MSCTNCGCDQPLNDLMDIDHVITVDEGGHVTEPQGIYAPELEMEVDGDGQILDGHEAAYKAEAARQGWELLEGFTGQHAYRGPVMHPSEYVGGGLEDHIRETPGTYVAIVVRCSDGEDAGWAVAYRPPPECEPAPLISQATLDEISRVSNEWPDGIHTCAELQQLEPGRRPCTCGRCRTE